MSFLRMLKHLLGSNGIIFRQNSNYTRQQRRVHLEVTTLDPEDGYVYIEVNARELLSDIPSLHYFCKEALKKEDSNLKQKYKEFKKTL